MKRSFSIICLIIFFCVNSSFAQIPAGYYDDATGTGDVLRANLEGIIDNHNSQSYSSLWTHFQSTDVDVYYEDDGTVMDMYSEDPSGTDPFNFIFVTDQCGNYSGEGDCYNREHSFPGSWFNDNSPMYTDLFHLYPTDGYVNGIRSNHAFGETDNPTYTSQNGSKRGPSSYPGYSGTVFEPIDEFKGDFARSYFYMATRYYSIFDSFSSPMQTGDNFSVWAIDMLIEWHQNDPVSQKEIDRNEEIYLIQGNRNPYIDHPEWVCTVFGCDVITDNDSEILFPDSQIPSVTISSLYDTEEEAVVVFAFKVTDIGTSDELPTRIENMHFIPAPGNTADWTDHIQGISIHDGTDYLTVTNTEVTDTYIDLIVDPYDIANNSSEEFVISLWLNSSNIDDNTILSLQIDANDHGFDSNLQYSGFATVVNSGTDILSENFPLEVIGTDLLFYVAPSDTELNEIMNPSPELICGDENMNIDKDYSESTIMYSTGVMETEPVTGEWNGGVLTFGDLIHTDHGEGFYFEVLSGVFEVQSIAFDIWCAAENSTDFDVDCGIGEAEISWVNAFCSEEIIIVVNDAPITGIPSGTYIVNSTDYTDELNPDFPEGGKVVYNGTLSPQTITGLTNGTEYWFKLFTSAYGMWSSGVELNCIPVGIYKYSKDPNINPFLTGSQLNIQFHDSESKSIEIIDLSGKILRREESASMNVSFDISEVKSGIYILRILFRDNVISQKLIINR